MNKSVMRAGRTAGSRGVSRAASAGIGLAGVALAAGTAQAAPAARYRIDPGRSNFTVRAKERGMVNATRSLATHDFTGQVAFAGAAPAAVQMTVKANSFHSVDSLKPADKQRIETSVRDPILQAGKYPTIVFRSTRIVMGKGAGGKYSGRILGNLTLHGVTRPVAINASGSASGSTLHASGSVGIRQSDFKITLLSLMGGAISVADDVTLSFDIVANKG